MVWGIMSITVTLTPEQEAWLQAHVTTGDFASVEEASRRLIAERIAELTPEDDDLEWVKPVLEQARADIARGDVISLEEHKARNAARLAALRE
jgi:antitoxin ParD1/3/4